MDKAPLENLPVFVRTFALVMICAKFEPKPTGGQGLAAQAQVAVDRKQDDADDVAPPLPAFSNDDGDDAQDAVAPAAGADDEEEEEYFGDVQSAPVHAKKISVAIKAGKVSRISVKLAIDPTTMLPGGRKGKTKAVLDYALLARSSQKKRKRRKKKVLVMEGEEEEPRMRKHILLSGGVTTSGAAQQPEEGRASCGWRTCQGRQEQGGLLQAQDRGPAAQEIHKTKAAGPLSTEMVEDLLANYIVGLLDSKHENKRLAAVWIHNLRAAICDAKVTARLGAIEPLRECLALIIRRPQAYRQQIYKKAHIHGYYPE